MKDIKNVNDFFDKNVEDYESKHYGEKTRSFMTVRQQRVLEYVDALNLPQGSAVLDAGCGPGFLLEALANRKLQTYGMDGSEGMLRSAESRVNATNPAYPASFKQGDIEHLPYETESFDLVCSTGVIEYLREDTLVLSEMYRVLKPGGYLILPVTNAWSPINYLDFLIEFLKRRRWVLKPFNAVWQRLGQGPVLPRHFDVRRHSPRAFRKSLISAGFLLLRDIYFYFLPWPRPFDRFFPRASSYLGSKMERFSSSVIGPIGEGYVCLCVKPK